MGIISVLQGCFANQIENIFKEPGVGPGATKGWLFLFLPITAVFAFSAKGVEQGSALQVENGGRKIIFPLFF